MQITRRADYSPYGHSLGACARRSTDLEVAMTVDRAPAEIVATLRRSIEASQRGSRKLRAHRFKDLFGFQAWSPVRREMVGKLLSDEGVVVQPPLEQGGREGGVG